MDLDKKASKYITKIEEYYKVVNVPMEISWHMVKGNLIILKIKFIPGTTEKKIRQYLNDVRRTLKLEFLQLHHEGNKLFFVAAKHKSTSNRLLPILKRHSYREHTKRMQTPYLIGFDVMGKPVVVDLVSYIHWLLGGSSYSGKTVGIMCMLISIIWSCCPSKVNLIVFDGASNLTQFDGIPHLSYPIIQDPEIGFKVMLALKEELEHRIRIKNTDEFQKLPIIICILDEFLSLISGVRDRQMQKELTETISNLLRRGRHGKIHMVLAAQDPTIKDMECDIGNITARVAFTCAKLNYSMTILGEAGAEKLSGNGELYFKSPKHSGLQYLQGAYISEKDIDAVVSHVCFNYANKSPSEKEMDQQYKFLIDDELMQQTEGDDEFDMTSNSAKSTQAVEDKLFAKVIIWALGRETVSGNMISDTFNVGWRRAKKLLDRLNSMEIAGDMDAKLPRAVLPIKIEDLPAKVVDVLIRNGYTQEQAEEALSSKRI